MAEKIRVLMINGSPRANGNTSVDIPDVIIAHTSIIPAYFQSPLSAGTNAPKKNVVKLNPIFASFTIPMSFFNLTIIFSLLMFFL